jgi:hypothetical protein
MSGASPDHRTSKGRYDGGVPFVFKFSNVDVTASGVQSSDKFMAPFDFVLKEVIFTVTDSIAATTVAGLANITKNGSALLTDFPYNGLASNTAYDALGDDGWATGYGSGQANLISKGNVLQFNLEAVASAGGFFTIVGNPI